MPIMFNFVDEALHQVTLFIKMLIVFAYHLSVRAGWNYGYPSLAENNLEKARCIIGLVSNHILTWIMSNQGLRLGDVMVLAASQLKAQGVAQGIHAQVDFGAEPASAPAQSLGLLTSLFEEAPAAQGWARTTVLSMIRCSRSGS